MNFFNRKNLVLIFLVAIVGGYFVGNFFAEHSANHSQIIPQQPQTGRDYFTEATNNLKIPQALSVTPPTSFSELVKKVQAAVVNIATAKAIPARQYDPFGGMFDPFLRGNSNAPKKEQNALGTGFIINEQGDIFIIDLDTVRLEKTLGE